MFDELLRSIELSDLVASRKGVGESIVQESIKDDMRPNEADEPTLAPLLQLFEDIQFWNKNKSMEGLLAKFVVANFVCQLVIFLYLLDNDTSWMMLASSGVGCCIEFWKIGKAMRIEIPMLRLRDRESYATNKTKKYDDLAMK